MVAVLFNNSPAHGDSDQEEVDELASENADDWQERAKKLRAEAKALEIEAKRKQKEARYKALADRAAKKREAEERRKKEAEEQRKKEAEEEARKKAAEEQEQESEEDDVRCVNNKVRMVLLAFLRGRQCDWQRKAYLVDDNGDRVVDPSTK
jgi:Skp family chaperone for outer membrane proteins